MPFLRLEACVSVLTSTGERRKNAAALGGGAFRTLGNEPPPGFADRREAIPLPGTPTEGRQYQSQPQPIKKGTQPGAFSLSRTDNGYFALK